MRLYTVRGKKTIARGLTLEAAAEVAIDNGGHLAIIDETTGSIAIADTDGDYMTIGATEALLVEYEKHAGAPGKVEPEPEPEVRRWITAPKRKRG
jgi:hypothetical protein